MNLLLVVAAPAEARAVLRAAGADETLADRAWSPHCIAPDVMLLVTGIGKVNAGGAVARFAGGAAGAERTFIVSLGVAGALPGSGLSIGDVIAASESVYADEGLETPGGFLDCAQMGFPLIAAEAGEEACGASFPAHPEVLGLLGPLARCVGVVATVSTCSGTDDLAERVRRRTAAIAECMEGAAVAHIARRLGIPCGELRVISNTTGDRDRQQWDLAASLEALRVVTGRLLAARG